MSQSSRSRRLNISETMSTSTEASPILITCRCGGRLSACNINRIVEPGVLRDRVQQNISSGPHDERHPLRYYDMLTVLATTVAVCTNMLVLKVTRIAGITFGAAVVFFPITYILGDVLTEVYGFRRARRV